MKKTLSECVCLFSVILIIHLLCLCAEYWPVLKCSVVGKNVLSV